jgi:hypothetical protein
MKLMFFVRKKKEKEKKGVGLQKRLFLANKNFINVLKVHILLLSLVHISPYWNVVLGPVYSNKTLWFSGIKNTDIILTNVNTWLSATGKECPVLESILNTCQSAENLVGDHGQLFLPLCSLHQICYLCVSARLPYLRSCYWKSFEVRVFWNGSW